LASIVWFWSSLLVTSNAYAQGALPTPDQLDQLLAPIALYPDALVAQICAASTDPQQILDADNWVRRNLALSGEARTNAAQAQGFDPAFISLVNFPQVLNMMAQNIDDFAAIGQAFAANQGMVQDSIQRLRQQAYATGALQSNQWQTVQAQAAGPSQVIAIQPANPQVVYVPQYNPQVIFAPPNPGAEIAASLITFGAGIALGAWLFDSGRPWGWGGWGWNWGHRSVYVQNNVWVVNNRYRPPMRTWHHRPPVFNRPIYARPPTNWRDRPFYRPPPGRPPVGRPGAPPPSFRPPGGRPPQALPPGTPSPRPPAGANRPPAGGNRPPVGANRPPVGVNPPPMGANRPPVGANRPPAAARPAAPQPRPNPYAGFSRGPGASRTEYGARPSAFGGGNNAAADRAASNRGRASVASQQGRPAGGNRR